MNKPASAAPDMKAALVVAEFYPDIAAALVESCVAVLDEAGVAYDTYKVPGALEIAPAIARLTAEEEQPYAFRYPLRPRYDCYIALGCVIRGETYHFEVVSDSTAAALVQLQLQRNLAVGNGILTVETMAQAQARVSKGGAAAHAALALAAIR